MIGIVGIELGEGLSLLLFRASSVLRPDPPDSGHSQSRVTTFRGMHDVDGRLLFPGMRDLCNDRQGDLRSASGKVEVTIERGGERGEHRLVDGEHGANGDPMLVFLDERPVDLDRDVFWVQLGIDRDVGNHGLAHHVSASSQ